MANVNMNNELGKFNNKGFREDKIKELETRYGINSLRESSIWESTGGKFETVFNEYMTTKQVASFFNLKWDETKRQCAALTYYTSTTSDFYEELTNNGMKKYTKDEFNNIRSTFTAQNYFGQSESLENNVDLEFPSRASGIVLWHLKAVVRLGMFMTKNNSAKLFRDAITTELQMSVVKEKVIEEMVNDNVQLLKDKVIVDREYPDPKLLKNTLKDLEVAVFDLKSLTTNINLLMDVKQVFTELSLSEDNPLQTLVYNSQIDAVLTKLINIRSKYYENLVADINTERSYTMTDIYKLCWPARSKTKNAMETKTEVCKVYNILISKGVFEKSFYTATTKDKDGNKVKVKKYKYVTTEDFDWMNYTKYGRVAGNNSDTITFSEVGKELIVYILKNDVTDLTDEKFLDWLYLQQEK